MKSKPSLIIIIFLFVSFCNGQTADSTNKNNPTEEVYTLVEEMPEYPGGTMEMMKFIQATLIYPAQALANKEGGKCFLKFKVGPTGEISNVQVLKSAGCSGCDKEAVRVVKAMPKWNPGKQNGKPVSVYFNLPITFTYSERKP
jgi:protein TonB